MAYRLKKIVSKRGVAILLAMIFAVSANYTPLLAPRAQAQIVTLSDIPTIVKFVLEHIGKSMAQKMLDGMVKSTINWANSGFNGNPAYVTNPGQFFGDIGNGVVGDYINGSPLGFLCSPFQAQIKLSIRRLYTTPYQPQCTLTQIGVNLENFYQNFNQGGWNAWFQVTQNDANNPYGAFISAQADITQKLASALKLNTDELNKNQGFLDLKACLTPNVEPPENVVKRYFDLPPFDSEAKAIRAQYSNWDPSKQIGDCLEWSPTKTPGSVIASQLNGALASGLNKLEVANDIDSLVSAFASGLLQRYVFGDNGLFGDKSAQVDTKEVIDVDGDGIPDGFDTNGDKELDICSNGMASSTLPASNDNCIKSKDARRTPYFLPLCESLTPAIENLQYYLNWVNSNQWDPVFAKTWFNKTSDVNGKVDDFSSVLGQYEVKEYEKALGLVDQYSGFLEKVTNSLAKDKDMRNDPGLGYTVAGFNGDQTTRTLILQNGNKVLDYLKEFQANVHQCDNPDKNAINNIGVPTLTDASSTPDNTGGGGGTGLSCSASGSTFHVGDSVTWSVTGGAASSVGYYWTGSDVPIANTTTFPQNLTIIYNSPGTKGAAINADISGGTSVSQSCSPSIVVTGP